MQDAKRSILSRVVEGALTPEQAANELEELDARFGSTTAPPAADDEDGRPDSTPPRAGGDTGGLTTVRVVNQMGSVTVIGDAGVQDVVADGEHVARREGDRVIIEVEPIGDSSHFRFGRMGVQVGTTRRLVVRMNPTLALEADIQAGSLKVHHVSGPIKAVVQAGSTTIEDFSSPIDVSVSAGSLRATGRLDSGDSRIRCDAGSVKLHLTRGSSVTVTAHTTMGKITLPGGRIRSGGLGDHDIVTIGGGAGRLDITATMGSVLVGSDL